MSNINTLLEKVDKLQSHRLSLRQLNPAELRRLRDEFIINNTYHSNAIEGNTLTLRETALILREGVTIAEKSVREHLEVIGHKDAFEYVLSLVDVSTPLSERDIRNIHALVLMNDRDNRGIYRSIDVTIMGAVHTPPSYHLVADQVAKLLLDYEEMKKDKHIIEAVAEFHLRFEGIHPFVDGNGRTGRLILNLELMKAGLLPVNIKFADKLKYYDCFDDYYGESGKLDTFVQLIAGYQVEELERYMEAISEK